MDKFSKKLVDKLNDLVFHTMNQYHPYNRGINEYFTRPLHDVKITHKLYSKYIFPYPLYGEKIKTYFFLAFLLYPICFIQGISVVKEVRESRKENEKERLDREKGIYTVEYLKFKKGMEEAMPYVGDFEEYEKKHRKEWFEWWEEYKKEKNIK